MYPIGRSIKLQGDQKPAGGEGAIGDRAGLSVAHRPPPHLQRWEVKGAEWSRWWRFLCLLGPSGGL